MNTDLHARCGSPARAAAALAPSRRLPVGAEVRAAGGIDFRVWAPKAETVMVQLAQTAEALAESSLQFPLQPEGDGYFSTLVPEASAGWHYRIALPGGSYPDPASRFQPQGPHGPSQIIDPSKYRWTDAAWKGVPTQGQVIYEMHIGTFTAAGTWDAAREELPELARLGVTLLEVMPVADFVGRYGWGYDGVDLFAPTRLYGRPDDFRAFVDRAHALGLGVVLDVVYNHVGPEGCCLRQFADDYFTDRYHNDWGDPINFDGPNSGPVREFFLANARYWIEEFHLDGLRLDATQQIFDSSPDSILAALTREVRSAANGRSTYVVAENEPQDARLALPSEGGGFGMEAMWNDDFHHTAMVALTGHNEAYYSDYRGSPQEFISAAKYGFLYQGQWYSWQKQRRGTVASGLHPAQFVVFLQNHDQIANSLHGVRLHHLNDPGRWKALTALLLLGPATPMLFQGQEFAASTPFHYFMDLKPEIARMVAEGRRDFLRQFPSLASAELDPFIANPADSSTFLRCKLNSSDRTKNAAVWRLHHDLLRLRRTDPVFSAVRPGGVDGAVLGREAFLLRFFGANGNDRLLIVNLGMDLDLNPAPEPLLAPLASAVWELLWSSDDPSYEGSNAPLRMEKAWRIPGRAAIVLSPKGGAAWRS
jgi:maltooligosyltrehalose trehalohydrolase